MLKTVDKKDRPEVIQVLINDFGISVDTQGLSGDQKYELLVRMLNAKIKRQIIASVTIILLSGLSVFLILQYSDKQPTNHHTSDVVTEDSTSTNLHPKIDTSPHIIPPPLKKNVVVNNEDLRDFLRTNVKGYTFSYGQVGPDIQVTFSNGDPVAWENVEGKKVWTYNSGGYVKILVAGQSVYLSEDMFGGRGEGDRDSGQAFTEYHEDMRNLLNRDWRKILPNTVAKLNAVFP